MHADESMEVADSKVGRDAEVKPTSLAVRRVLTQAYANVDKEVVHLTSAQAAHQVLAAATAAPSTQRPSNKYIVQLTVDEACIDRWGVNKVDQDVDLLFSRNWPMFTEQYCCADENCLWSTAQPKWKTGANQVDMTVAMELTEYPEIHEGFAWDVRPDIDQSMKRQYLSSHCMDEKAKVA
eukprot:Gb_02406 [translate_table: standard]